jgi:hypothetical protein
LKVYQEFAFAPRSSIFHQIYSKMESFPHPIVRMGLAADWPSSTTIQTYQIYAHSTLHSEDILVTAGRRDWSAVYSVWNIRVADGETSFHSCNTYACAVCHVSFSQQNENVELRTGCDCGRFNRWNISSYPYSLLEETQLGPIGSYEYWADDGSKVISLVEDSNGIDPFYQLCIAGCSIYRKLCKKEQQDQWQFSPGHGDKVLRFGHKILEMWECISGHKILQKLYNECVGCTCFSPDGNYIVCITGEDVPELISSKDGTVLHKWDRIGWIYQVQFFPTGTKFIVWDNSKVYLFDGEIWHQRSVICHSISISPDGERVAIITRDGIEIFNYMLEERLERHELDILPTHHYHLLWVHSNLICINDDFANNDNSITFHRFSHSSHPSPATSDLSPVCKLFLSPNSCHLLTIHENNSIHLWGVKSGHHQSQPLDGVLTAFSMDAHIDFASDSSNAILWDKYQVVILQLSAGIVKRIPTISYPSSTLLAVTFFAGSASILTFQSNGSIERFFVHDMSHYSMPPLLSQLKEIRQLAISPKEKLVAICSDIGLVVYGISQNIQKVALSSSLLVGSGFSPDSTHIYTLEITGGRWMLSSINTRNWNVCRVDAGVKALVDEHEQSLGHANPLMGDGWSVLRFSWVYYFDFIDQFFDLSTGQEIIPALLHLAGNQVHYMDHALMTLPEQRGHGWSSAQGGLAYIHQGRAIVIDSSSLITQM